MRFNTIFRDLITGLDFQRKAWDGKWVTFNSKTQSGLMCWLEGKDLKSEPWSPSWEDLMTDDWIVQANGPNKRKRKNV
jgi:hypothetical protein